MLISESEAIQRLKNGEVIGIPTDTVYGFAVLEEFQEKLYTLKKREKSKKLINFIYKYEQIGEVDDFTEDELQKETCKYWPGQITLIFVKNHELTSFRIPQENNALNLLRKIDIPLLTTSANISGEEPCQTQEEFEERFPKIGLLEEKEESTKTFKPSKILVLQKDKVQELR